MLLLLITMESSDQGWDRWKNRPRQDRGHSRFSFRLTGAFEISAEQIEDDGNPPDHREADEDDLDRHARLSSTELEPVMR
jgi:hypothetical protein